MWWLLGGDHQDGVAVLGAKLAKKIEHMACLADGLSDVAEGVGELLEAASVGGDVYVTLGKVAKLSL